MDDSRQHGDHWMNRLLRPMAVINSGELGATLRFLALGFLLLASYYIVRALREGFILVDFGAGARSTAVGVAAALLIVLVPLYSRLRARFGSTRLITGIYAFFVLNMIAFHFAWQAGWHIGFVFFVWVGLFGLLVVAQFWALASGAWNEDAGKRLFPLFMVGANLGALVGTEIAAFAAHHHGMKALVVIGVVLLVLGTWLVPRAEKSVPDACRAVHDDDDAPAPSLLGGFSVVLKDRYLLMIAVMVVLLNWVNSTGEYLFADFVERHALATFPGNDATEARAEYVTGVYAHFMLWYTVFGLMIQAFLVSRLFRWIGIGRSAIILPVFVCLGYLLLAFVPIFSIVRWVKVSENAIDYSLMGTIRHALFLPTSEAAKFDGKTAIDTFFWRMGDLIQAGVVYAGIHWLDWSGRSFALVALGVSILFLYVSWKIAKEYRRRVPDDGLALPNRVVLSPGEPVNVPLPAEWLGAPGRRFSSIAAHVDDGSPLPPWLLFDAEQRRLGGRVPDAHHGVLSVEISATDDEHNKLTTPVTLVTVRHD